MPPRSLRIRALLLLVALPSIVSGQEERDGASQTDITVAPAGVRRYEPGTWSTLAINAANQTEVDTEEFVSVFIGEATHLQFARRFWLPAAARRQTFLPIYVPPTSSTNPTQTGRVLPQTAAFIMRLRQTAGAERFAGDPGDTNIVDQPLLLDYTQTKSGMYLHRAIPDAAGRIVDVDRDAYETVYKSREATVGSRVIIDFSADFIPPFSTTLNSLDQMVISGDRILNDSAGLANLRRWLQQGGRIWIMLDRTSMETVVALLGNAAACSIVDRVELNEFEMHRVGERPLGEQAVEAWSSEIPVEMVRVFPGTDDVVCRIDGWPAAFWQKVGDGEVLFTALGPRGWVEHDSPEPALEFLAQRFFQPREQVVLDPVTVRPMLADQIGYRIPSRGLATWILGLNALAILSCGCWWTRTRRLERLAWFVPGSALLASAVFLVIGSRNTEAIPSTVALGQIIRVSKATNDSHISAVTAMYRQDSGDVSLTSANGTLTTTGDSQQTRGDFKRIVWDDDGRSRWSNLQQASGVIRFVETTRTVSHGPPLLVHGTFDAHGFRGTLVGLEPKDCEDAVIVAAVADASAVSLDAQGTFHVGNDDVMANGQFIAAGLMSDKQRSRQQLLRQLLRSTARTPFGTEPSLLVWTPPMDMGVEFDTSFQHTGSALVSIPLRIDPPATGAEVRIPSTFIRLKTFTDGGQGASTVFNQRTGEWLKSATRPTRTQLRCVLPRELLPLQLNRATVTIKINAPSRSLRIEGVVAGQPAVLHQRANPNGVLRFVIDRPEALEVDAKGGLQLSIVVTETEKERQASTKQENSRVIQFDNSTWQIDYVRVDAEGTMR